MTIEPMPTSASSSSVQPCRITLWPTVQLLPIVSGKPGSVWQVRIVLHVGAFADLDPLIVAAQHRAEPDAGRVQKAHLADHDGGIRDEIVSVRGEFRPLSVEFVDRHSKKVSVTGDLGIAAGAGSSEQAGVSGQHARRRAASSGKTCRTSGSRSRKARSPSSRIRSGGARSCAPRSVLRMMMKGAANTRNGTAANVFGATPSPSSPNPAGRAAIA